MRKRTFILIIIMIAAIGLTACTSTEAPIENEDQEQVSQEDVQDTGPDHSWIVSIEETITIEGMDQPITLNFFDGERNFITYVPEDMLAEIVSLGEGYTYRFYANYLGNKNENAYLQFYFFSKEITEKPEMFGEKGRFTIENLDMKPVKEGDKMYKWSLEEYSTKGAYGILGEHEGQYFSMLILYPGEFAEGFVPRANKIIDHLYWTDTNEYLVK